MAFNQLPQNMDKGYCRYKIEKKTIIAAAIMPIPSVFLLFHLFTEPTNLGDSAKLVLISAFFPILSVFLFVKLNSKVYVTDQGILLKRPLLPDKRFFWSQLKDRGMQSLIFTNGRFSYRLLEGCTKFQDLAQYHFNKLHDNEISIGYSRADKESLRLTWFLHTMLLLVIPVLGIVFVYILFSFFVILGLSSFFKALILAIVLLVGVFLIKRVPWAFWLSPFLHRSPRIRINRSGVSIEKSSQTKHYSWDQVKKLERSIYEDTSGIFHETSLIVNSEDDIEVDDDRSWHSFRTIQTWANSRFPESPVRRYKWSDEKGNFEQTPEQYDS